MDYTSTRTYKCVYIYIIAIKSGCENFSYHVQIFNLANLCRQLLVLFLSCFLSFYLSVFLSSVKGWRAWGDVEMVAGF